MTMLKWIALLGLGIAIGWGAAHWPAPPAGPAAVAIQGAAPGQEQGLDDMRAALAAMSADRRRALLEDADAFADFAERRGQVQVLVAAATAAGLTQDPAVARASRQAAEQVVAARYLEREAAGADLPAPTEADIERVYREQQARLTVPDRLPVWQIFIEAPAGDSAARDAARTRARELLEALLAGKSAFAELAGSESAHGPSRANGGYMGLLAPEELKPEVRRALLNAPQGKPVGPVETDAGFHLVQRGALVPGRVPPLEEVRPQLIDWLRQQAMAERQAAVVRAAAAAHPPGYAAADVETWRETLRAESGAGAQAPAEPKK